MKFDAIVLTMRPDCRVHLVYGHVVQLIGNQTSSSEQPTVSLTAIKASLSRRVIET
jgi:hypothetical protein